MLQTYQGHFREEVRFYVDNREVTIPTNKRIIINILDDELDMRENHPLEVSSKEELYKRLNEGLDDVANGRGKPLEEAMKDIRKELAQYGV